MEESWGLSASLASNWLARELSLAKTTISGQQTSPYACVSIQIMCRLFPGTRLQRGKKPWHMLCCYVNIHHGDRTEFIMAWSRWWPTMWWMFNRKCLFLHLFPFPSFLFLNVYFAPFFVFIAPSLTFLSLSVRLSLYICLSLCPCTPLATVVPCMSNFTAPSGTVLSPDYPEGYGNNMNCVWLIQSDPGSRIHLAFNDFDLEAPYDSLTVKDGETNDAGVIGRFSGAESPSHLTSNTNTLRLEFQADHSMSGRGFNITYSSTSALFPFMAFTCFIYQKYLFN